MHATSRVQPGRLAVKRSRGRILYLKPRSIDWIEAANQYVRLHLGEREYLIRGSMTQLESRLDPGLFARIHRSAIVNLARIQELRIEAQGSALAVLHDGQRLKIAKGRWHRIHEALLRLP